MNKDDIDIGDTITVFVYTNKMRAFGIDPLTFTAPVREKNGSAFIAGWALRNSDVEVLAHEPVGVGV